MSVQWLGFLRISFSMYKPAHSQKYKLTNLCTGGACLPLKLFRLSPCLQTLLTLEIITFIFWSLSLFELISKHKCNPPLSQFYSIWLFKNYGCSLSLQNVTKYWWPRWKFDADTFWFFRENQSLLWCSSKQCDNAKNYTNRKLPWMYWRCYH